MNVLNYAIWRFIVYLQHFLVDGFNLTKYNAYGDLKIIYRD